MKVKIKSKKPKEQRELGKLKDKTDQELLDHIKEIGVEEYLVKLTRVILARFN